MSIFNYLKNIGKKAFLVGLAATVIGCSSVRNHFSRLENSVNYQNGLKSKVPISKTEDKTMFYNPLLNLTPTETDEVTNLLQSITANTYNEFLSNLSNFNEKQITLALSSLAKLTGERIYEEGRFDGIRNSEEVYNVIKDYLNGNPPDENILCGHIHNFVCDTAKKAGLPEAVTVSCNTKKEGHVISTIWWSDGSIKLIDYGDLYFGNSNLESLLRMYQKNKKLPAFDHSIYKNSKHIFSFETIDGNVFYNAIDYPKDTTQLKQVLTEKDDKKDLEVRLGNTENSVRCSKNKLFFKIGNIKGPEGLYWETPFAQVGVESSEKDIKYNINFLTVPVKHHSTTGVSGNVTYKKIINLNEFDKLSFIGQSTALVDLEAITRHSTLINENNWFTLGTGVCYTNTFDKEKKADIYALVRAEPVYDNVLTDNIKPVISEVRTGAKLTSGNTFVNPEYVYDKKSDKLNLTTGWSNKKLDFGFTLSTSNTRYKRIWPDENSFGLSINYNPTDSFSVGGSFNYSQKKWSTDDKYNSKVSVWVKKEF